MSEHDKFLRKFAVEIATTLRENEEHSSKDGQNQRSIDDSVEDLYQCLVFDEPLVNHISNLPVVSSALSRQLLMSPEISSMTTSRSYAVSNRLVNGIIYLCNQKASPVKQKKIRQKTGNHDSSKIRESISLKINEISSHSMLKISMAKLAFCILVDLPLQCCSINLSSEANLKKIRRLLGSFKGTSNFKASQLNCQDEVIRTNNKGLDSKKYNEESAPTIVQDVHPSHNIQQKEIEEILAAESDPSDYDYSEGENLISSSNWQQQEQQYECHVDWLDPKVLSKPDPDLTIEQIRDAIGSLLRLATYTLLEPIFSLPEKETSNYISRLKQLVLVLLQPLKKNESLSSSSTVNSMLFNNLIDHTTLSPLWIIRDAAMYHRTDTLEISAISKYEQCYLQVLQTLLAMDRAHMQDVFKQTTTTNEGPDLCVSSIIGLSSLSSWCASQRKPSEMTIDTIIDSMNDIEHIMERRHQIHNRNLPNTLVPILESLSGIHYDHLNNNNATSVRFYKGCTIPQTLLNSGFLRQILLLADTRKDENKNGLLNLLGFHHAIWGLCIAYPTIVGKYVFRYPGSSQIIRSWTIQLDTSMAQSCVQCILWNIYGWFQCKESGGGGLNTLRKPDLSATSQKLTQNECSEVCKKAWLRLCQLVNQAVNASDINDEATSLRVIEEWRRLLILVNSPYITEHFKTLVDSSLLHDVSVAVSNQFANYSERTQPSNIDSDDKKKDKPSQKQKIILQAHNLLKKYRLFFQGSSSKID